MIADCKQILVVDDEALSRDLLSSMIVSSNPSVKVQQVKNGESALEYVFKNRVDIAFLDIDMPGLNGLVLAENLLRLQEPPVVVFATGSPDHALRGFELQVVDYLLKPFERDRVEIALQRALELSSKNTSRQSHQESVQSVLNNALNDVGKLWAERENGARVLIDFSQIGWAQARDKEVFVQTASEELKVRLTLNALEARLSTSPFVRVHRTWLVNINLIRETIPWDSHSMTLVMGDVKKTEIPVSRTYASNLKNIAGW